MKTVAIVQARMGSSRLPGKVLVDLDGQSMLGRVVERVARSRRIDDIVIATSTAMIDDAVAREAHRVQAHVHRGSEHDVLHRYLGAALAYEADVIVRMTADCPLLDPSVIDQVIDALGPCDYVSNTHVRSFPRGLDVEVLHRDTLERIGRLGTSPAAREHVTAFVMERPELFVTRQVVAPVDDSDLRWTVDTPDDLALVRALYELGATRPYRELVADVRARGLTTNSHIAQKPWEVTSVR
jgi:spore coat polysaccharide biosynthesis protein SpsF